MKHTTTLPLILGSFLFSVSCATSLQDIEQDIGIETPQNVVRLSDQVVPQSYDLDLYVDPTLENFQGQAQITFNLKAPARSIVLHGQDLIVESATLELSGSDAGPVSVSWKETHDDGTALLQVCEACGTLSPGLYTAVIKYTAPFAGDLDGLYRVQYDGNWYAFTQFEPLAARKAFPGFDEPRFKTPFSVTIHRRAGDVAIANEESIAVGEEVDRWVAERFKE
ncbi:MAG: hypothetical protein VX210_00330, partial [Myxococcota bacterium]|nr:hypothetical protein [Myxococcota bacterium]